ncbi:recombinase family protein [Streptomyces sp. SS]|uniref:recombinase family protein n=1 Tax=Streptomyces sp. SS TaxID=260742 RepID=UPI00037BD4CC|nr:recombinase family protein [Streptomyces sp. SS]
MELVTLGAGAEDMIRAVTYERQSHRSETDSQASPKMQRDKSIAYINSQENWTHIDTDYSDVGLSGYDPNVIRPGFERLMEDAKAKKFDVVVIYMLSRLTRQGAAEALKIQQELAKHGVALVSTQEPFINTSDDNPFGVAFFALIAGLAHRESKNKSKFIRDAFAQLKARGSHSSGPVPFGFAADTTQVDGLTIRILSPGDLSPEPTGPKSTPADTVEYILKRAEDGTNPSAIASALTEARVRTPLGSLDEEKAAALRSASQKRRKGGSDDTAGYEWSATVVGRILRDPRIAGFAIGPVDPKTKRRQILRDNNGDPVRPHKGFRDPVAWYAIQAQLDGRAPAVRRDRTGERTLLGSWGKLRCAKCGSGMTVSNTDSSYVCNLRRAVGDVPRHVLRVPQKEADETVAERVWARISGLDASDPDDIELLAVAASRFAKQGTDPEAAGDLAEQEAQLAHVQQSILDLNADRDAYAGPTARKAFQGTMKQYADHEERCMARIEELTAKATASTRLPLDEWTEHSDGDPFAKDGVWMRWDVDERRTFLDVFVDHISLSAAETKRGTTKARTEARLEVVWVQPPEEDEDRG